MDNLLSGAASVLKGNLSLWKQLKKKKTDKNNDFTDMKGCDVFTALEKKYHGFDFINILSHMVHFDDEEMELSAFNVMAYAAQNRFGMLVTPGLLSLFKGDEKQEFVIKNHIPIIGEGTATKVFCDVRASLEIASMKGGRDFEPMKPEKLASAQAMLTPASHAEFCELVAEVPNPHKCCLDSAEEIYKEYVKPLKTVDSQRAIHTLLIKDYAATCKELAKGDESKYSKYIKETVVGEDVFLEETGLKLVPSDDDTCDQVTVSNFRNTSMSFRGENRDGLSGMSGGYAFGMQMGKEEDDMMNEMTMLRNIRHLHPDTHLWVSGMKHLTILYSATNVPGPISYVCTLSEKLEGKGVQGKHNKVDTLMTAPEGSVKVDFTPRPFTFAKTVLLADRRKAFGEWFKNEFCKLDGIRYRKVTYILQPVDKDKRNYRVIPFKSIHNMWVMLGNMTDKEPYFTEKGLLYRIYIANYIRNNWVHCASTVNQAMYKGEEFNFEIWPPYTTKAIKIATRYTHLEVNEQVLKDAEKDIAVKGSTLLKFDKKKFGFAKVSATEVVIDQKKKDKGKQKEREDSDDGEDTKKEEVKAPVIPGKKKNSIENKRPTGTLNL